MAYAAHDSTVHSNHSHNVSDDENAGEDFLDVVAGGAGNLDPPPPYESIHERSSVSNTPPPAINDLMLSSADGATRSGRLIYALSVSAATESPSNEDILLEIRELDTAVRTRFSQMNDALALFAVILSV